jgi:hypothetical protein
MTMVPAGALPLSKLNVSTRHLEDLNIFGRGVGPQWAGTRTSADQGRRSRWAGPSRPGDETPKGGRDDHGRRRHRQARMLLPQTATGGGRRL